MQDKKKSKLAKKLPTQTFSLFENLPNESLFNVLRYVNDAPVTRRVNKLWCELSDRASRNFYHEKMKLFVSAQDIDKLINYHQQIAGKELSTYQIWSYFNLFGFNSPRLASFKVSLINCLDEQGK